MAGKTFMVLFGVVVALCFLNAQMANAASIENEVNTVSIYFQDTKAMEETFF
jgi:hypothetical protein